MSEIVVEHLALADEELVNVVAAVVIVLAVVVIVGDDETRGALLSRLRGDGRASPDT
jgi:hypothetical protein